MTNEKKLEVLEEALNYYQDRTSLTNEDEKELQTFFNELKQTILVTRCCETLPTDDEIYSEGCKYVRKIEQPNRQPLITLRQTFKAGAIFVKKRLDN